MKTQPLNFVRAQKAKRPSKTEIAAKIQEANRKYYAGVGRCFEPSIYTR